MRKLLLITLALVSLASCSKNDPTPEPPYTGPYVPGTSWETVPLDTLGWNKTALADLYSFLELKNTKSFMILKGGKIAAEKYYGTFKADSSWFWASAGKTMTAALVNIAVEEGKLSLDDKTSKYLGAGWSSAPRDKEDLITVRHHLTMTTGLKPIGTDPDCTLPSCLAYDADAGTKWLYQNASYSILEKIIAKATGKSFETYFQEKIRSKIGMTGNWNKVTDYINVYNSDTRSMARFGLLMLRNGKWKNTQVVSESNISSQIASSQNFNPSYGQLTWLNGKSSYMIAFSDQVKSGAIVPTAPADMYFAWGKYHQKIYVVPSLDIVVVRFGAATSDPIDLPSFDVELWTKIMAVVTK